MGPNGVPSNMKAFSYTVDFGKRRASIPGDGMQKVAFLHSGDLARYAAAMVDVDGGEWPGISAFVGDRMSWGEMLALGEEITGTSS